MKNVKSLKNLLITCVLLASLAGCATQSFTLNADATTKPERETMQTFFINGLGQEQTIDAAKVCGGAEKVAKIETIEKFTDGLLGLITYGIYTPRTAKVYCTL